MQLHLKAFQKEKKLFGAPFGEECKKALDYMLELGKKLGFKTKNLDGYCGYIEFGEGEEMVGIIRAFRCCSCQYRRWLDSIPI